MNPAFNVQVGKKKKKKKLPVLLILGWMIDSLLELHF